VPKQLGQWFYNLRQLARQGPVQEGSLTEKLLSSDGELIIESGLGAHHLRDSLDEHFFRAIRQKSY
jgi:hypothetical protein